MSISDHILTFWAIVFGVCLVSRGVDEMLTALSELSFGHLSYPAHITRACDTPLLASRPLPRIENNQSPNLNRRRAKEVKEEEYAP